MGSRDFTGPGPPTSRGTEWAKKVLPTLSNFGDAMKDTSSLPMKSDEMR